MLFLLAVQWLVVAVSAYKPLSDNFLVNVPAGGADFDLSEGQLLAPLLMPRVPGTPGHKKAQEHFLNFFKRTLPKWKIEQHNLTAKAPATGNEEIPLSNLVFKREPPWTKPGQANFLTLAAHYDTRSQPEGMVGATDSAAACAILMHVAWSIDRYVTQMHDEMAELQEGGTVEMDMGIQIVFLDGKAGFSSSNVDPLYGSRFLAEKWEAHINPALSWYKNYLEQIPMLLVLDLLGAPNPNIPAYFQETHWAYKNMATIERRLRKLNLLGTRPAMPFFREIDEVAPANGRTLIIDDHIPFMARGVPVFHLQPSPFPPVWHTLHDSGRNLDMPTLQDWSKIVTAFALEWLDMMEVWPQRRRL